MSRWTILQLGLLNGLLAVVMGCSAGTPLDNGTPTPWEECAQQQKLVASDASANDEFSRSVSTNGDTTVVGAERDDSAGTEAGSAYVYVRHNGDWTQQQKLTASDATPDDNFGSSVSVSGDTAIVGAPFDDFGSAYVFVRSGGVWTQQQKLTPSDTSSLAGFGMSVSVSGDTTVVGAPFGYDDVDAQYDTGWAFVFVRSDGVWTEQQKLRQSDATGDDLFGWSVSVSGDTAFIGARNDDQPGGASGSAYVFFRAGGVRTQQQKLTGSDVTPEDNFAWSVSVSGDTAVVGALFGDDYIGERYNIGSAYVFIRSGGMWTQQQKLTAALDANTVAQFGISVSVVGDTVVVGAQYGPGSAYVFVRSGGEWTQQQMLTAPDASAFFGFGSSVSVSGDIVVVGAYGDESAGADSGSAYVFSCSSR